MFIVCSLHKNRQDFLDVQYSIQHQSFGPARFSFMVLGILRQDFLDVQYSIQHFSFGTARFLFMVLDNLRHDFLDVQYSIQHLSFGPVIFLFLAVGIERDKCMENVNGCNLCIANFFFSGGREVENYSMLIYLNLFCSQRGARDTGREPTPLIYIYIYIMMVLTLYGKKVTHV